MSNERQKRGRFQIADVTDITLHTWPRADEYLTRIQPYFEFIYTTWFTLLTLSMFGVMGWMWADKFGEIWRDSFAFYNFTKKSNWDLVEFWFLFGAHGFFPRGGARPDLQTFRRPSGKDAVSPDVFCTHFRL